MIEFLAIGRVPGSVNRFTGALALLFATMCALSIITPDFGAYGGWCGIYLFGALIVMRGFKRPTTIQLLLCVCLFVLPVAINQFILHLVGTEVEPEFRAIFGPQVFVSMVTPGWRAFAGIALPFLLGASMAQPRFSRARFILGYLLGAAILSALFFSWSVAQFAEPPLPSFRAETGISISDFSIRELLAPGFAHWLGIFGGLLGSVLAVSFASVREAMERGLGMSLTSGEVRPKTAPSFLAALLARLNFVLMLVGVAFFAVYGRYERRASDIAVRGFKDGNVPPPGAANAADVLSALITRGTESSYEIVITPDDGSPPPRRSRPRHVIRHSGNTNLELGLIWSASPELLDSAIAQCDRESIERLMAELEPYFGATERLDEADGLWLAPDRRISWAAARTIASYQAVRSALRASEGRRERALRDLESILNFAWFIGLEGDLLHLMVAANLRGIALAGAHNFYLRFRGDPEALGELEAMLTRMRRRARVFPDWEMLRRNELSYGFIVPNAEFMSMGMGGWKRNQRQLLSRIVQYDQLTLALALERYRMKLGRYPDNLDALAPDWMAALPRNPMDGAGYEYQNLGEEFGLECQALERPRKGKGARSPTPWDLPFPQSKAESADLRATLTKLKAPPAESAFVPSNAGDANLEGKLANPRPQPAAPTQ